MRGINNTHPKQKFILYSSSSFNYYFLICFMIDVMYWSYHHFKYLVLLFTLLGFYLCMLNKYRFKLGILIVSFY